MKKPTSTKTTDIQPVALLEMSPHGNSSIIPKMNDYFKESPMQLPNIQFTINVEILFTKFANIYM